MASACKPTDWKHNAPEACTYVAKKLNFGCWLEKQKYDLHALQSKFISAAPASSLHIYLIQLLSLYSSANWLLLPAAKVSYQKRGENTLGRNISCKNWCSYFFHALWQLPKMLRVQQHGGMGEKKNPPQGNGAHCAAPAPSHTSPEWASPVSLQPNCSWAIKSNVGHGALQAIF